LLSPTSGAGFSPAQNLAAQFPNVLLVALLFGKLPILKSACLGIGRIFKRIEALPN